MIGVILWYVPFISFIIMILYLNNYQVSQYEFMAMELKACNRYSKLRYCFISQRQT